MNENEFDLVDELDRTLKALGLSRHEAVSELVVDGRDPLVPSTIRLGSAMGIALLSSAVGAAQIWRAATGRRQRLGLDLGQALHQLTPYLGGGNTLNGYGSNMGSVLGLDGTPAPALWDLYRTADDRWAIPIACYPHTRDTFLDLLGTAHTREHIGAAIAGRVSWELEEEAAARGVPLAIVRSREEFLAHPQGRAVLDEPLVAVERVGDAPPRPLPAGDQPLSGLRSLQFTHVFAGTAAGRVLAEQGADVLHVCEPNAFDHDLCWNETGVGLRSARLALGVEGDGRRAFDELLRTADVFVHNHRPAKMARLGLTPEECAEISPGIIHVSVRCYGHSGPWQDRGGFDQHAQALTGVNWSERRDGRPQLPPGRMLNDYLAAYLAAAGVMSAVLRRAREGGSYRVKVSLAGVANWAWQLGTFTRTESERLLPPAPLPPPRRLTRATPLGDLSLVAPPVSLSETPPAWRGDLLVPRGSSQPRWYDDRAA
ncbi:CoA transferase [Streptomyces sp. G44]|uniref:CoA transferase n=1 Tax=Streptomyces sp. G44 TaxID=2807632 RepID=UPI001960E1BB|nr:CoA transferase [Streptomyces sp. G44]MBM7172009.1 CoA transferase [Streptomyces sp. G44]